MAFDFISIDNRLLCCELHGNDKKKENIIGLHIIM